MTVTVFGVGVVAGVTTGVLASDHHDGLSDADGPIPSLVYLRSGKTTYTTYCTCSVDDIYKGTKISCLPRLL